MKKIFLLLLMLPAMLLAAPVDPNLAQQVAENFINAPEVDANGVLRAPKKRKQMARALRQITNDQQFYVFNGENGEGFVIVAADDVARPILGYSQTGSIDADNIPDNLRWWLSEYNRQIRWAQENGIEQSAETTTEWQKLNAAGNYTAATIIVDSLLRTKWSQESPYNNQCPQNVNGRAVTGCVATAMAQLLKFYNYPTKGRGSHSYNDQIYGLQSVNFGNTTYNWSNMPNSLTSNSTSAQKNAVATLMYHCGVSVEMKYNTANNGSFAAPANIVPALRNYFNYDKTSMIIAEEGHSMLSWYSVLVMQLQMGHPVLYGGTETNCQDTCVGHQFLLDGYNSDYKFHINWGWGSLFGWWYLFALNPDACGTGGGNCDFNSNQFAVFNAYPAQEHTSYELQLASDISTSSNYLTDNIEFEVSATIVNLGDATFSGNIYAAVTDAGGNVVMLLDSISTTLRFEGSYSSTWSFNGEIPIEEGEYWLTMMSKNSGESEYSSIGTDYFLNNYPISVYHSFVLTPGKYVIVANRDKDGDRNWYYMTSDLGTASTKRFQAVSTGTESMSEIAISDLEDKYVWTLEADGDNWKLKNGTQYITWTTGNSANLGSTGKSLTFEIAENQVQAHFNDGTVERYLSLNATTNNNYFAFYGNTNQITYLYFLPYEEEEPPVIPQPESDRYVVLAQRNASSNWFYMTSDLGTASNKRYQAVDAGTSTLSAVVTTNLDDKYYWEIEENKLKTGTQYSTWFSGNTANLDDTGKELTIQQQTDGTYTFSFADGTDTRYLALNATAGNNYFAYYKGTNQIYRLTLVKEGENGSTVGVENLVEQPIVTKILRNGQILILRGDKTYTLTGQEVR